MTSSDQSGSLNRFFKPSTENPMSFKQVWTSAVPNKDLRNLRNVVDGESPSPESP